MRFLEGFRAMGMFNGKKALSTCKSCTLRPSILLCQRDQKKFLSKLNLIKCNIKGADTTTVR